MNMKWYVYLTVPMHVFSYLPELFKLYLAPAQNYATA